MATIQIRTEIPGPRSRALMARREVAIPRGPANATPVFAARADGATIEDVDGNRYIDFAGGIGCLNIGHSAPRVISAIQEQLEKHLHLCFAVTPYEGYVAVAEKLNSLAPGNFTKKTILLNSGAEAIENAVKIARAYTKRPAVICFEDAFHGRTLLTMSLTSKTHPYKAGFQPFASDIYRIPFAYPYRNPSSTSSADFAHHLEDAFKRSVAPESVAALIVEPIQGEGGFVIPPRDYFKLLQNICRKHGILFIADEIQSGFARSLLAEMKKAADLIAQLRQGLIISQRQRPFHESELYRVKTYLHYDHIVSRYIYEQQQSRSPKTLDIVLSSKQCWAPLAPEVAQHLESLVLSFIQNKQWRSRTHDPALHPPRHGPHLE